MSKPPGGEHTGCDRSCKHCNTFCICGVQFGSVDGSQGPFTDGCATHVPVLSGEVPVGQDICVTVTQFPLTNVASCGHVAVVVVVLVHCPLESGPVVPEGQVADVVVIFIHSPF